MILLHLIICSCVFVLDLRCNCFFSKWYIPITHILCVYYSYHYFKFKAPRGTPILVQSEDDNAYDPHALACLLLQEMECILEAIRKVQLFSKSQGKSYTLEDVKGQQTSRVQYFLNTQLHGLLRGGKITRIEG